MHYPLSPILSALLLLFGSSLVSSVVAAEPAPAPPTPAPATPAEALAALEGTFGSVPGQRRNHIKGSCAFGYFVGTPALRERSRSALFSGATIPVVARFSLAGGNPQVPDTARSPRGMALQFKLPSGAMHHMAMLSTPEFGAADARSFVDQIQAAKPDPATGKPDPQRIAAFKASHPDNATQARFLATHNPPRSFADASYFGIHTFMLIDRSGKETPVRWQFVPRDGERALDDAEMKSAPRDFLEQRLMERVATAPILWDMRVRFAEPGDVLDDPTVAWPPERPSVVAGTLSIRSAAAQKGAACEPINFDPMVLADGIAASADPILHFRSPSYALSFAKRVLGQ